MESNETVEQIHSLLLEVDLPSSLADLKNPTDNFIVNVIMEFFRQFHIDVNEITSLTMDQLDALSVTSQENAPIAPLINLREAMATIGPELFVKDFSINDITSPAPKKTKKCLKFIGNFVLYARNKKFSIQPKFDKVLSRGSTIENVKKEKESLMESMNERAVRNTEKLSEIEIIEKENEMILTKREENKEKISILTKDCAALDQEKITSHQASQSQMLEVQKNKEKNESLKSKVVKSPSKHREKLEGLIKEYDDKQKERETVIDAVRKKKPLILSLESNLNFVQQEYKKLDQLDGAYARLMDAKNENEKLKRTIEEADRAINLEGNIDNQDQCEQNGNNEVQKCKAEVNQRLLKLKTIVTDFTNEKKQLNKNMEKVRKNEIGIYSHTDKVKTKIVEIEKDTEIFLKQCQELYDSDIKSLKEFHEKIKKTPGMGN